MFGIGEFSKITGLTVKTLRFYHERGILIPAHVESGSGYRFYNQGNVETARAIVELREFGFSLEEIAKILREKTDDDELLSFLERRKQFLNDRIARDRELISSINRLVQREREARAMAQQQRQLAHHP